MLFGGKKIKCNVKYKDKKYIYELDKHKTIKDIYDLISKEESAPSNLSSLTIKLCSNKLPYNTNDFDIPLISLEKDKFNELYFEITKPYNCSDCQKLISKYCLICSKYYCLKCNKNDHNNHDFIDIDPTNFKESVYLWSININANLSNDITQFNKLKDFIKDNELLTKIKLWKDNIIKKLNTFEKFINEICEIFNKIGNNYISKKSEILNKLMLDFSKTEQIINNELSIGKEAKNNYDKYFSFDEAEILIQKLKLNYNDIISKNTDIKELAKIENINNLNNGMGNINSQIDDLSKNGLLIFNSFQTFFNKYDNDNFNNKDSSNSNSYEKNSAIISNSNPNKMHFLMKNGNNLKNKMINIGMPKNNLSIVIKDTTLSSKESFSTSNGTKSKLNKNKNKRVFNSFKKDNFPNQIPALNLYNDLNLSKIKTRNDENLIYSDRYQKHLFTDRSDKLDYLPLITKI